MFAEQLASGSLGKTPLLKVIESYSRYYAAGQSHTARAKRLDLKRFIDFLARYRAVKRVQTLKINDWDFSAVQKFVDELLSEGEAPATVARRLATIKHMGRALAEKVPGFTNPAREVKAPKLQALCPKSLDPSEIEEIRAAASNRAKKRGSFNALRNQTLLELLLDTGIRAEEARLLKTSQLDDQLEWIKSVKTKGRRYRNVYITSSMRPRLKEYLMLRERALNKRFPRLTLHQKSALPLFPSFYRAEIGKADSFLMGAKTIWRAVNEFSAGTPLHPHLLRHSFAVDLLNSSKDIRLVSQALGHSDVRVTMRYTEREEHEIAVALERSRENSTKRRSKRR
ncbi:MAG: tyrosine-type recombinase/integrase [Oligoflexia bacterium]|nr:tyrosine-type recombinase/integrase [Oligoflexia bacterium]